VCKPNYITSRLEGNIKYVMDVYSNPQDFWIKSHPRYSDSEYPYNLDCYVSFKTRYKPVTQYLKFEVIQGSISGDAYLAFGDDYGDKEKYTLVDGFTKVIEVPTNKENRRRIMMHWYSGTTQTDKGFLAKLSVSEHQ